MALAMVLFLSTASLILASQSCSKGGGGAPTLYPITMTVYDTVTNIPNKTYSTGVAYRGILIGAMKRAQEKCKSNFRFTTTDDPNYGPYLQSVNYLKADPTKQTYWELVVKTKNGTIFVPDVGIGCYIPNPDDNIIFKFTKY